MKSRTELWQCMLADASIRCSVSTSELERDTKRVLDRVTHEGDSFFTVTLPSYGKSFEQALRRECIDSELFVGWSRKGSPKKVRVTPIFLGGLLDRVFNSETGRILEEPCIDSIQAIRQLTLAFGKLKELCSPELIQEEYKAYLKTDEEIHEHLVRFWEDGSKALRTLDSLRQVARTLFGAPLSKLDSDIWSYDVVPKHGPGATADRLRGNMKFDQREWPVRMEQLFPFMEYAVPSRDLQLLEDVNFLPIEGERPVKLTAVPKDATKPRLIAEEPTCMQYMQQAISRRLTDYLQTEYVSGSRNESYEFLGFIHQWPNQAMAQIGSEDGSLATLDLSEASDRVPNWLVDELFADFPWFAEALSVTRSRRVSIEGLGEFSLSKFASMGSALTFPIEAMIFLTIVMKVVIHGEVDDPRPVISKDIQALRDKVRIYGDDIIVPVDSAEAVVLGLETLGFRVNKNKSFWTGQFRESCGKEYFAGEDVSIVRFRKALPTRPPLPHRDATDVVTTVSTRNLFYEAGYWTTTQCLDDVLEIVLRGHYPYVGPNSPVLGRRSYLYEYDTHGIDSDTQAPLVKGYVEHSKSPVNPAANYAALMKCLLINGDANTQSDHLERSGRPRVVSIKRGMARPY